MKNSNKNLLKASIGIEKLRAAIKDVNSLPTPKTLTFKLQINYVQADSDSHDRDRQVMSPYTSNTSADYHSSK